MKDQSFPVYPPEFKQFNKNRPLPEGTGSRVRVYRSSPDRVTLQIRGDNKIATASLPFDVARAVAAALSEESGGADELALARQTLREIAGCPQAAPWLSQLGLWDKIVSQARSTS